MDILAAAALVTFATQRIVDLIKSLAVRWKDSIPWPAVSAIVAGLLAWGINLTILPTVANWLNYVLIGFAVSAGSGGLNDLLALLQVSKEKPEGVPPPSA